MSAASKTHWSWTKCKNKFYKRTWQTRHKTLSRLSRRRGVTPYLPLKVSPPTTPCATPQKFSLLAVSPLCAGALGLLGTGQKTKRAPNAVSGTLSNAPAVSASLTQQPLRTASRPTSLAVATPASVSKSLPSATKATLLSSSTSSLLSSPGLPSKSRLQSVRTVVPATSPSTSSALSLSQEAPCAPHRAASLGTGGASHNSKKSRQASARSAPHGHEHVAIPKKPQPGPTLTISLGDYAKLRFAQNGGPEAASSGSQGAEIIEIKETSASEASQSSVLNAKAIDSSANEAMVPKAQFEPHFGVCGKDPRADNPHDGTL